MAYTPLDSSQHRNLCFDDNQGYGFAANMMVVPATYSEAGHLSREYALLIHQSAPTLFALLGAEKGRNAYVTPQGQWVGRYLPAHIRAYPFSYTRVSLEAGEQMAVLIDAEAPHFHSGGGQPLFDDSGQLSALGKKFQRALLGMLRDNLQTAKLIGQLEQLDVLKKQRIDIKATKTSLSGFRLVDPGKLRQLAAEDLLRLEQSGALLLAHAQIISLTNLDNSALTRPSPQQRPAMTLTEADIFGDDEMELDFSAFTNPQQ